MDKIIKVESENLQIANLLQKGSRHHQQGNFSDAQALYEQILAIYPDHFDALQLLGVLFAQIKKYSQAVEFLSKALKIKPNHVKSHSNLGIALKELKRFDEALASYNQAIKIEPDYVDAHCNLGNILQELKRYDEALASFNQAIAINADYPEIHFNRGNILQELKRFDEALASFNQAIKIKPDYAEAYYNRGTVFQELNYLDEALASFNQAIKIKPDYVEAHWNSSLCNLKKGNFKSGWEGYEWRWASSECNSKQLESNSLAWNYKKTDKRLLVWSEQGVGDHIFFGSLLSELSENIPNLLVQIDKRLIIIFSRSFPKIKFYSKDIKVPESDYDIQVPIGSLGRYLRNSEKYFVRSKNKFLISDQKRTQAIRHELSSSKKLICGISWDSKNSKLGAGKSLPLERLATIFNPETISLVNLQYGDVKEDIELLKSKTNIELIQYSSIDNFNDLDGLSSLIDACDFIVSISNVTIHLSSALGKESYLLLSHNADWRWMLDRRDSPWYPSVNLYRQKKIGYWDDTLDAVRCDLDKLLKKKLLNQ